MKDELNFLSSLIQDLGEDRGWDNFIEIHDSKYELLENILNYITINELNK